MTSVVVRQAPPVSQTVAALRLLGERLWPQRDTAAQTLAQLRAELSIG